MGPYDERELADLERVLAHLPYGHPLRAAVRGGAGALMLAHLAGSSELSQRLLDVWLAAYRRSRGDPP